MASSFCVLLLIARSLSTDLVVLLSDFYNHNAGDDTVHAKPCLRADPRAADRLRYRQGDGRWQKGEACSTLFVVFAPTLLSPILRLT